MAVAVVIPRRSQSLLEEGMFRSIFLGWWNPVFAGGFGKNGWLDVVFDGEVVVDWWWKLGS